MSHDHPTPELSEQARVDKLRGVLGERFATRRLRLLDLDDVPPPVQLDAKAMLDILASTAGALGWCPITAETSEDTITLRIDKLLPVVELVDEERPTRGPGMSPCVGCGGHHFKAWQYDECAAVPRV